MYFVTYAHEYPIYAHEEGGYYYSGVCPIEYVRCNSMKVARKYFKRMCREHDCTITTKRKSKYNSAIQLPRSKYIGEDRLVVMKRDDRPYQSGYHPYE